MARKAYREVRVRLARINAFLQESISGMRIIQIFHQEKRKFDDFEKINRAHLRASLGELKVFAIFRPFLNSLYYFGVALLIWIGGGDVLRGAIEFGVLTLLSNMSRCSFEPINHTAERYNIMQAAMEAPRSAFSSCWTPNPRSPISTTPSSPDIQGKIEFRNVWFAYNPGEWVLKDVSFTVEKGQTVAIVGATGAGKTSIINLISRLYDIQKGQILIDGIDIKTMDVSELRRNIAVVLQDVFMFSGTIADNIRLNNYDIDDERIHDIAEAVDADKFISALPRQYQEPRLRERGATLSAGQRQLVAFARALVFNPKILVLDEATANIDTETEQIIQRAMRTISKDRTTIVVAHRRPPSKTPTRSSCSTRVRCGDGQPSGTPGKGRLLLPPVIGIQGPGTHRHQLIFIWTPGTHATVSFPFRSAARPGRSAPLAMSHGGSETRNASPSHLSGEFPPFCIFAILFAYGYCRGQANKI